MVKLAPSTASRSKLLDQPRTKRNTPFVLTAQGTTQLESVIPPSFEAWRARQRQLTREGWQRWRVRNPDRANERMTICGRAQQLLRSARERAKTKGQPFELTLEWVTSRLIAGSCEKTWLPFVLQVGKGKHPLSPSIDQIVPGKGYTRANSQMVVWIYNAAKQDGTHDDVVMLARAVVARESEPASNPTTGA